MSTEDPTPPASDSDAADSPPAKRASSRTRSRSESTSAPEVTPKPVVEPVPSSRSFWTRIDHPFVLGFLITLGGLAAFALGLALTSLSTILIYIALAMFAALGLDPAVRFLERHRFPRPWALVTVLVSLIVLLGLIIWAIVPVLVQQIASFVKDAPGMIEDFQQSDLYITLSGQFGTNIDDLIGEVTSFFSDPGNLAAIGGGALKVGASIANGVSGAIIVLVLIIYFVATLSTIKRAMLRLIPARDRANTEIITDQITDSVGGYIMGMVLLAFFNSLLVLLLYTLLGLPFPLLLAVTAFLVTLIPLVGPVLFWIIGSVVALFTDPILALIFAVVYVIYMQVEAYFLTPKVMNRAVSVPGSLVVIGALIGGTLLGLLGALVAVPVTASILIIIRQVWVPRQDARI
ncbi:AI-2E family transporter [Microbacterium sp. NPDC056234]|uniref:AI-2E family transporter n=1 Tax=Microbacterium sp. NPDC056234 TaxID=3345757 RepID=UPI0035D7F0DF